MVSKQNLIRTPTNTRTPIRHTHIVSKENRKEGEKRPFSPSRPTLLQRATHSLQSITPTEAAHLQRTIGNQALGRISRIQAKLTLGPIGDKYEQEADAIGRQVVQNLNTPNPQAVQRQEDEEELQMQPLPAISTLQRQEDEEELQMMPDFNLQRQEEDEEIQMKPSSTMSGGEISADIENSIQTEKGSGRSLPKHIRTPMEQSFGADFSGVKIHTNSQSDQLNQSIQARAFTTGQDIFFRQGEYNPGNSAGQELLAHELTHTIQQTGGKLQRNPSQISRISTGLQRNSIQRVALPTLAIWKNSTKLKRKRRSRKLRRIDKALTFWHDEKNKGDQAKREALNKLLNAIQAWQMSREEGGTQSKRRLFIHMLLKDTKNLLGALQQGGEPPATLSVNVDVESDDPMDRKFGELLDTQVGHAWVTLSYRTQDDNRLPNIHGFTEQNKRKLRAGEPQEASFGFWPKKFRGTDIEQYTNYETFETEDLGSGTLRQPDESHDAKASKDYPVTEAAVNAIGNYVEESKGKTYRMYKFNCTSFAMGVVKAAGHTPPQASQKNINQPNKLYKSLHWLKLGGDSSVTDQIEVARTAVNNPQKTYANLTPEEAKAIILVSYQHPKIRDEIELNPIDDVHTALENCWGLLSEEDQEDIKTPDQRIPKLGAKIQQYVTGMGRKYGLQMASVLLFEDNFKLWHENATRPGNINLASTVINSQTKNYTNATEADLNAIMTVILYEDAEREDLGLSNSTDLTTLLWELWEIFSHQHDLLRASTTRLDTIRNWIQREGQNDNTPEGRLLNLQLVALVMHNDAFNTWLRWAEVKTRR